MFICGGNRGKGGFFLNEKEANATVYYDISSFPPVVTMFQLTEGYM